MTMEEVNFNMAVPPPAYVEIEHDAGVIEKSLLEIFSESDMLVEPSEIEFQSEEFKSIAVKIGYTSKNMNLSDIQNVNRIILKTCQKKLTVKTSSQPFFVRYTWPSTLEHHDLLGENLKNNLKPDYGEVTIFMIEGKINSIWNMKYKFDRYLALSYASLFDKYCTVFLIF